MGDGGMDNMVSIKESSVDQYSKLSLFGFFFFFFQRNHGLCTKMT